LAPRLAHAFRVPRCRTHGGTAQSTGRVLRLLSRPSCESDKHSQFESMTQTTRAAVKSFSWVIGAPVCSWIRVANGDQGLAFPQLERLLNLQGHHLLHSPSKHCPDAPLGGIPPSFPCLVCESHAHSPLYPSRSLQPQRVWIRDPHSFNCTYT
jgi:hypothetical protein